MLPVPFGRRGSFPWGQNMLGAGHSAWGKAYGSHHLPSWKEGLGAPDTSAIRSWRRAQAGRGTERRISRQGCPQWFLSALGWHLSYKQGAKGQRMNAQRAGGTETPTHITTAHTTPAARYRHIPPDLPEPGQATHTASYLRASLFQLLSSRPAHSILQRAATAACLTHNPQHLSTPTAQLFHLTPLQPP